MLAGEAGWQLQGIRVVGHSRSFRPERDVCKRVAVAMDLRTIIDTSGNDHRHIKQKCAHQPSRDKIEEWL